MKCSESEDKLVMKEQEGQELEDLRAHRHRLEVREHRHNRLTDTERHRYPHSQNQHNPCSRNHNNSHNSPSPSATAGNNPTIVRPDPLDLRDCPASPETKEFQDNPECPGKQHRVQLVSPHLRAV